MRSPEATATRTAPLGDVDDGGTVVWAWTGDNEDTVDDDTTLFRLDISEDEETSTADRVHVGTEFGGAKAHLGSSVLYTVQLQDGSGDVTCRHRRRQAGPVLRHSDDHGNRSGSGRRQSG